MGQFVAFLVLVMFTLPVCMYAEVRQEVRAARFYPFFFTFTKVSTPASHSASLRKQY
jgi:hypothetical protein